MPLAVCKKLNGQLKPTIWDVTQLDKTSVKVVGEMENVLIRLSANKRICHYIDIVVADIPEATTCKQETEPLVEPAKSMEDDEEEKDGKIKEEIPTKTNLWKKRSNWLGQGKPTPHLSFWP